MTDHRDGPNIREFARFAVVGLAQNGLNLGVFGLAISSGVPYIFASIFAATAALALSFSLNLAWTFPGRTGRTIRRAARFVTLWVTILLLGLPVLALLVSVAHLPRVLAQAIVILIGAPASYAAQRRWTFGRESSRSEPLR
jgi:putative flippase GtrA